MMTRSLWMVFLAAVCLSSCAKLGFGAKKPERKHPYGATGIPPQMRSKNSAGEAAGMPVAAGGNAAPGAVTPLPPGMTAPEDIVYTDPDNPEATLPELATILAAPKRGPWEFSEATAKQRSVREGKPLLIWFTDSKHSPMCKAVSQELFATNEFGAWATENLIRLKVDSEVEVTDQEREDEGGEDLRERRSHYVSELNKRYKVMGFPSMVMLNSSGEVVAKYHGYKRGDAVYLWGQMKHAAAVSSEAYKGWRSGLEKKGYREWQDRKQRKIFAKLTAYSAGRLQLIEPDGTRAQTREESLCDADQAWIAEQKKLRNLQ